MSSRKNYKAELKAELALESLRGNKTVVEISSESKIPPTNIYDWRDKLINEARTVFLPEEEKNKKVKNLEQEIITLQKLIGEITIENNFLKKKLKPYLKS